jgi:hypothetical protein
MFQLVLPTGAWFNESQKQIPAICFWRTHWDSCIMYLFCPSVTEISGANKSGLRICTLTRFRRVLCFLCSADWILKCYLDELRLQRIKLLFYANCISPSSLEVISAEVNILSFTGEWRTQRNSNFECHIIPSTEVYGELKKGCVPLVYGKMT